MVDFLQRELKIGQHVVYSGDNSSRLELGRVIDIHDKSIRIERLSGLKVSKTPDRVCIVDNESAKHMAVYTALRS